MSPILCVKSIVIISKVIISRVIISKVNISIVVVYYEPTPVSSTLVVAFPAGGRNSQYQAFWIKLCGTHERDWVFNLSHPVQMNRTGFKKKYRSWSISARSIQKIPFPLVQQKLPFDDWTGLVYVELITTRVTRSFGKNSPIFLNVAKTMRLHHSPKASTYTGFKQLCFVHKMFFRNSNKLH